ncbi:MAG TPA: NADP-dependent isocitrate dehydrogenase [Gemmatimonadaceae bacterium]|jgi:isocitrate dehydrogenase|nr:NADP-dependent isocitrate dehydrogenase [Gemmatimonadaceae bacterium]
MSVPTKKITVLPGDGIGPEVVSAALRIISATNVHLEAEMQEAGAKVFAKGIETGVPHDTIASIERTHVVLKGPLETPIGYGNKSANVTLRKLFETFGNIRPVRELPGVDTPYKGRNIDIVIVRENVEDLYAGVEYMQTPGVAETLKLISRTGCEKIVNLAFEYAVAEGRKRIHCATKANIMKLTEGMLQHTFAETAAHYPQIEARHILVDNCAHQLVMRPEQFDVIVATNMNGDILSDLTAGLTGGLGFAPSANIGSDVAMFEAVHGSAPDIAGKNIANPTALILSAAMMLRHIGEGKAANDIEQAVLVTLEQNIHTYDMQGGSRPYSTTEFTDAIISNLGRHSSTAPARETKALKIPPASRDVGRVAVSSRHVIGVDVFIETTDHPDTIASALGQMTAGSVVRFLSLANRGATVYPQDGAPVGLVDHYRCRFLRDQHGDITDAEVLDLLQRVGSKYPWMHVEKLQQFDGVDAFSKAQG